MLSSRPSRTKERGQALPEFAIVAPVFFLLLFGVIQVGLIFAAQNGLVNAVRDTARRAATYRVNNISDYTSICPALWNAAANTTSELNTRLSKEIPGYSKANVTASVSYQTLSNNDSPTTYYVVTTVSVAYANPLYVPLVGNILDAFDGTIDNKFTLHASEQMRVENPDLTTSFTQNC